MYQFGLTHSTANRLGGDRDGGNDLQRDHQPGQQPPSPFGKQQQQTGSHDTIPTGRSVFRSQHKSIANDTATIYGGLSHTGAGHATNASKNLYRATRRPDTQKFQTPVGAQHMSTTHGPGAQTPPLFSKMNPGTSKYRGLQDTSGMGDRRATHNFGFDRDLRHLDRSAARGIELLDPLLDNTAEEQSTSKPNYSQAPHHVLRNPTLQANIVAKDVARQHDFNNGRTQGTSDKQTLAMSFGASQIGAKTGNLYNKGRRGFVAAKGEEDQDAKDSVAIGPRRSQFSQKELRAANKAVNEKMEVHMRNSENDDLNDLVNQARVFQAVYQPLTFMPAGQIFIPDIIVKEMAKAEKFDSIFTEMSRRHPIVYFGIGSKLFVWDYKHSQHVVQKEGREAANGGGQHYKKREFRDMVQSLDCREEICCIKELNSINRLASWQQASQADDSCRYLIVATNLSIRLLTVKRVPDRDELNVQDTILMSLPQGPTTHFIEFEKLGRVFYSREGGKVSELTFENTDVTRRKSYFGTFISMITTSRKRLHHVERQKEHIIKRAIPNFFKFTEQDREVVQLRIDEQRNLLYSLCQTIGENSVSLIEVFDLGMLGNEFKHQTTIHMFELAKELDEKDLIKCPRREQRKAWAEEHRIIDIQAMPYSESKQSDLLLTTRAGERIYIHLDTAERPIDIAATDSARTEQQLESLGIQSDYLIVSRIVPGHWQVVAFVPELPEEDEVLENERLAKKIIFQDGLFSQHLMQNRDHRQRRVKRYDDLQTGMIHFDSAQGLMIYHNPVQCTDYADRSRFDQDERQTDQAALKLGFLQRNTPGYALSMRQRREKEHHDYQVDPCAVREAFSLLVLPAISLEDYGDSKKIMRQELQMADKRSAEEQLMRLNGFVQEGQSGGALVTAGFFKEQKMPSWNNHAHTLPYLASSEYDRQVYLQSGKLNVLTNRRLVQVTQLRPIDKLYTVLESIVGSHREQVDIFDDFMDFAAANTMEETCAMLVQILADSKASFQVSSRTEDLLQRKKAVRTREARNMHTNMSTFKGSTSMRSNFNNGGRSSMMRGRNQANQTASMSRTMIGRNNSKPQQVIDDKQYQHQEEEEQYIRRLNELDANDGSFVHLRQSQSSILRAAMDMLSKFGDSIGRSQFQYLHVRDEQGERLCELQDEASRLMLYSHKHRGLYLYAFRVLRPIWRMRVTSYASAQRLHQQEFNRDQLMPAQQRLLGLLNLISQQEQAFIGLSCKNQQLVPDSNRLADDIVLINQLDMRMNEQIEVAERQSLEQLRAFLQNCVDVIEFISFIESEVELQRRPISELIKQLEPIDRDLLSKRIYCDFVVEHAQESKNLAQKLLEKTIFMQVSDDAKLGEHTLHQKQQQVSNLCPTLFSPLESRLFLGMSLLQNATRETDPQRQDELVTKALDTLLFEPDRIDMERVVPLLAKLNKLPQVVAICEQKILRALNCSDSTELRTSEIKDMLEIIVQVVDALDRGITKEQIDAVYGEGFVALFSLAVKEMRYDYRIIRRDEIVNYLANSKVTECIEHLLRAFLVKGCDVDFICDKLEPYRIGVHCTKFVLEQSQQGQLMHSQFDAIVRLLSKSKLAEELAQVVSDLLLGHVELMTKAITSDDESPTLYQLSCSERQQLTKNTLQLMDDCAKIGGGKGLKGPAASVHNPTQVTGTLGSRLETRQQLQKKLQGILISLDTQVATLKSVQSKISLIESFQQRVRGEQERNEVRDQRAADKLKSLKLLKDELEYSLMSHSKLSQQYELHSLNDRRCIQLFQLEATPNNQQRLKSLQEAALSELVDDLDYYCGADERQFSEDFGRMATTIFTGEVIQKQKRMLFYVSDYVTRKRPSSYDIHNLKKGDNPWFHDLLLKQLRVSPSDLINHYKQTRRQADQFGCFVLSLSVFQQQMQILNDDKAVAALRHTMYENLTMHGTTLYQGVIGEFCIGYIKSRDQQMLLPKNDQEACAAFFERVNSMTIEVLKRHVPTFSPQHVCSIQSLNRTMFEDNSRIQQQLQPQPAREDADMQQSQPSGPQVISLSNSKQIGAVEMAESKPVQEIHAMRPGVPDFSQKQQLPRTQERSLGRQNRSFAAANSITRQSQPNQLGQSAMMSSEQQFSAPETKSLKMGRMGAADEDDCQLLPSSAQQQSVNESSTSLKRMRDRSQNRQ